MLIHDTIPLVIGRQSSGEAHIVNLCGLPNLFISHSLDRQLPGMLISFIDQLLRIDTGFLFALSLGSRLAEEIEPLIPGECLAIAFMHHEYEDGKINSIDEFISTLVLESKKRKAFSKRRTAKLSMAPLLVFIDDIFEVIMSAHKKTALSFIELLLTAAAVDIFFVIGSSGIYRNLLEQLINVTPSLKKKLNKSVQSQIITQPLGAELVMNPDGLIFFREKGEKIYRRLYP